jgi:hypothetical protein
MRSLSSVNTACDDLAQEFELIADSRDPVGDVGLDDLPQVFDGLLRIAERIDDDLADLLGHAEQHIKHGPKYGGDLRQFVRPLLRSCEDLDEASECQRNRADYKTDRAKCGVY